MQSSPIKGKEARLRDPDQVLHQEDSAGENPAAEEPYQQRDKRNTI
jgi:hypothetical protein